MYNIQINFSDQCDIPQHMEKAQSRFSSASMLGLNPDGAHVPLIVFRDTLEYF